MAFSRTNVLCAGLLAFAVACGDETGPGVDGPMFLNVTIDHQPWAVDHIEAMSQIGDMVIKGTHTVADSGLRYDLAVFLVPFKGTGSYRVDTVGVGLDIRKFKDGLQSGGHFAYFPQPASGVVITEYRASDTTVVGTFNFKIRTDVLDDHPWVVSGSFRVRPGYF